MAQQKPPRDLSKFVDIKKAVELLRSRRAFGWHDGHYVMMRTHPSHPGQFVISITRYQDDRQQETERWWVPLAEWEDFLERFGLVDQ